MNLVEEKIEKSRKFKSWNINGIFKKSAVLKSKEYFLNEKERWKNAVLADNFVFYKVMMEHSDVLRHLLELLLNIKIQQIEMDNKKSNAIKKHTKSVRLEVCVKDNQGQIFDVEIQTVDKKNLSKRALFYQGITDSIDRKNCNDAEKSNDSFMIFLCMDDIFGAGLPIYTFQNICMQDNRVRLDDRNFKLFFIAKNSDKMQNEELRAFFNLLKNDKFQSKYTENLSGYIQQAKTDIQKLLA